ncbi:hypothetical protein ACTA71_010873 [Dictyostelium dimigraforme]
MTEEIGKSIIIECGSGNTKVGFSDILTPRDEFPTVVGRTKYYGVLYGAPSKKVIFAGHEVKTQKSNISIKHPVERGSIVDWNEMEQILNYSFNQVLNISSDEYPVLISDSPFNSKINRERMIQIMFETYNVLSTNITNRATLSLIVSGKESGLVSHCGYGESYSVAIYQGKIITEAMSRLPLGGNDLSNYLMEFLKKRNYTFNTHSESSVVNDIKEKLGYLSCNFQRDIEQTAAAATKTTKTNITSEEYELVDGRVISLNSELFQSTEPLFQPSLIGCESIGIHEHIYNSFLRCNGEARKQLLNNVVLSGGSTLIRGFSTRLSKELSNLSSSSSPSQFKIIENPDRKNISWIGGSILSSLSSFRQQWITPQEYDEYGPQITSFNILKKRQCNMLKMKFHQRHRSNPADVDVFRCEIRSRANNNLSIFKKVIEYKLGASKQPHLMAN